VTKWVKSCCWSFHLLVFSVIRLWLSCIVQCERAARIQKQMQTLWRNRIPMCIEVLLYANCRHGQLRCSMTDIAPPDASDSCMLLEQWTIQNVAKKWVLKVSCSVQIGTEQIVIGSRVLSFSGPLLSVSVEFCGFVCLCVRNFEVKYLGNQRS